MKLIVTAFILILMGFSEAYSQRVTYSGENVSLEVIFTTIQKQTGYGFFYAQDLLKQAKPVTIKAENLPVSEVLAAVFKNQALDYSIENKTILISKKKVLYIAKEPNVNPTEVVAVGAADRKPDTVALPKNHPPTTLIVNTIKPGILQNNMGEQLNNSHINPGSGSINFQLKEQLAGTIPDPGKYSENQSGQKAGTGFLNAYASHRKALFAEITLFDEDLGLSANFDMRLKPDRNDGLGLKAGIRVGGMGESFSLPLGINYVVGKRRSSFEAGYTIAPALSILGRGGSRDLIDGFLNIGYRYQPVNQGPMLRLYWSPILSSPFGLSAGYSFYNLNKALEKKAEKKKEYSPPVLNGKSRKSVFIEGLGMSAWGSFNFDMRLKPDRNDGLGIRVGAGFAGAYLGIPLSINYIAGKRKSGFESGIGITSFYDVHFGHEGSDNRYVFDVNNKFVTMESLYAGYRFQAISGLVLRATVSAIHYPKTFFPFWPGLSIGYRLK